MNIVIPTRKKGGQGAEATKQYETNCENFAIDLQQIQSNIDFPISSRGWAYYLEGLNLITKSEFDVAENAINTLRKSGLIPVDFTAKDLSRRPVGIASKDYPQEAELIYQRKRIVNFIENQYQPILLSDVSDAYIELVVEKVDLVGLFSPICQQYQIPITNAKGWSDINSRADLIKRCEEKHRSGCDVHILYCGDFDPAGLVIGEKFTKNLHDLTTATGVDVDFINFSRFGLNYDYINDNGLIWTDNLLTGAQGKMKGIPLDNPRHVHHEHKYVQDYLNSYCSGGTTPRKVEANALLRDVPKARALLLNEINTLVSSNTLKEYTEQVVEARVELLETFNNQWSA